MRSLLRSLFVPGLVVVFLPALSGCGLLKKAADKDAGAATTVVEDTDQVADPKVGDEVVVESGKASFWRGKITAVDGPKITYEYGSSKSTSTATKTDVYVIRKDHKTVAKAGNNVICRYGTDSWDACVVKSVSGSVFACEDSGGTEHNLTPMDVILPNPATQADVGKKIATNAKHRAFYKAARAAGNPAKPPGWKARPGMDVVALFAGSNWYGAKVTKVTPDKVTVAWDDKTSPSERNPNEVALKPVLPQTVSAGQYAIVRPSGSGSRWDFHKVVSVAGTSVTVADQDDNSRTVTNKDLLPIVP